MIDIEVNYLKSLDKMSGNVMGDVYQINHDHGNAGTIVLRVNLNV